MAIIIPGVLDENTEVVLNGTKYIFTNGRLIPSIAPEGASTGGGISYVWESFVDRIAQLDMEEGDQGLQVDTGWVWQYTTEWVKYYKAGKAFIQSAIDPTLDLDIVDDITIGDEWYDAVNNVMYKRISTTGVDTWATVGGGSSGVILANDVVFNNMTNGYTAITVQAAIEELEGKIPTSYKAADVVETGEKQFLTAVEKASINSNAVEVASFGQRIADLEAVEIPVSTGMVKTTLSDTEGYLADKLGATIVLEANKLEAIGLKDLTTTIEQLNFINGITSNIQTQINALTKVGNFTGSSSTYANLTIQFPNPQTSDMVIVLDDETKAGVSTIYLYNGMTWEFVGDFTASIRDFTVEPLNLATEVTGILPSSNYQKQTSAETPIINASNLFTAVTVEEALIELFTLADSFKKSVVTSIGSPLLNSDTKEQVQTKITNLKIELANAITARGVATYPYNTFAEMSNKVRLIPLVTIDGGVKVTDDIIVTTIPYTHSIILNSPLKANQVTTSPTKYVGGAVNVIQYETKYPKSDASLYDFNDVNINVNDGISKSTFWSVPINKLPEDYSYLSDVVDLSIYSEVIDISSNSNLTQVNVIAIKSAPEVVVGLNDISLFGIYKIKSIVVDANELVDGKVRYAVSFNGGLSWNVYRTGLWENIDITTSSTFSLNGMTVAEMNALTTESFSNTIRDNGSFRIAYFIDRPTFSDRAIVKSFKMTVDMLGVDVLLSTTNYEYTYDEVSKTLTYKFKAIGQYKINYVDGD